MANDGRLTATIESLLNDGTIVAHKDGNYGSNYPRSHEFGNEGVPFLTAKLLDDGGSNRIAIREAPRLGFTKANLLTYGFVETDDVLLSHNATIGRVAVVPKLTERALVGTSLTYFRLNQKRLLPRYLAAYFKGRDFQNQLRAVMSHSTRNQVPITAQRKLTIVVPPFDEQQRIADIIGTLDEKIELNRRMNETLEAMARRLFRSWFVDFDPVHAKAALRRQHPKWTNAELSRRALPNMAPEIAELFPDGFEDSKLGTIPKGWTSTTWGEIATLEYGKSLSDYRDSDGCYRVYGTNGPIGWHSEPLWNSAGIIIGRKGAYRGVHYSPKPFFVIDTAFYLKPKTDFDLRWAYLELLAADINGMDSGSAIPSTSREDFYAIPVRFPNPAVLTAFGNAIRPGDQMAVTILQESKHLRQVRDKLLPSLLSGELSI